jgi:outer membrane receptor protein involved in Fe transport
MKALSGAAVCFFLLMLLCLSANAQQARLTGVVKDPARNEPVSAASVALLHQSSEQVVVAIQTGADGVFTINNIAAGVYGLRISRVGFNTFERSPITLSANQSLSLDTILLLPSKEQRLQEVVIQTATPAMKLELDRKVFNPEQSIISKGGSAIDLLSNVPTLSVDAEGNVAMRGVSNVRVLIDGKPSALAGNNMGAYLQSLPANSVARVELLTNPSAKYDPEGQGGIINIVMKKNARLGLNGSVTAGIGSFMNYNAGVDLNYKHKKVNYYLGYDLRRRNNPGDGYNNNTYRDGSRVYNTSESKGEGLNHSFRGGIDYQLNDKNSFGISSNINRRTNGRTEDFYYTYYNPSQDIIGTSPRNTRQDRNSNGADVNLDYKRLFKREGESLTANVSYGKNEEDGYQTFTQTATAAIIPIDNNRRNNTQSNNQNINIQLDYTLPLKKDQKIEAGYRSTLQYNKQQQLSDTLAADSDYYRDYGLSNDFKMDNIVHALYVNYQRKFGTQFSLQAGLRAEQAYLNTEYISLDPNIAEEGRSKTGRLDYFRLYPSVFLSRTLNKDATVQLSYTRRVNRPNGWQVNPFVNISDPVNYWQGNPNLQPEDIHSFELGYTKRWGKVNVTSSVYHRITRDIIQSMIDSAAAGTNVTYSTFRNIGRNNATGVEIVTQLNLNRKLDFLLNTNANYQSFGGQSASDITYNSGISWDANLTANWKILKPLSLQLRGGYTAPRIMAQGTGFNSVLADAGLRWSVLKDKGNISVNARNIFNRGARWGSVRDLGVMQTEFLRNWTRGPQFGLTFNYRFGISNMNNLRNRRSLSDDSGGGGVM